MASKKISELSAAGALTGAELVEAVQGGQNVKTTTQAIANLGGGGGAWGSITGTLSSQTDLQTALDAKQALVNAAVVLTDGANIALTATKHTLTTDEATITFTISYTGDDITIEVTLNATTATYTFPAGSLCRYEGVPSGDNTMILTGASGDKHLIAIKKIGSVYYPVGANFEQ